MSQDRELFSDQMLEGEYTTWTQVWVRDYGAGVTLRNACVDNFGRCYATAPTINTEYVRDYDGNDQIIPGFGFRYVFNLSTEISASITKKYVLDIDAPWGNIIRVWRWGVLIWTLDLAPFNPDYDDIYVWVISPNGKFIAVVEFSLATGDPQYLILLEGH